MTVPCGTGNAAMGGWEIDPPTAGIVGASRSVTGGFFFVNAVDNPDSEEPWTLTAVVTCANASP